MMLGTRRPAAPLDQLELERPASKIPKEDALSIYEATLQKLRHGSRRAFATTVEGMKHDKSSTGENVCPAGGDMLSTVKADQAKKS